ncbi:hypothetical protein BB560_005526 [Smittium megazygosporum]|uniref:Carbohydrate-binding module family 19 domain-containing protein n=1 Tax=Smittium megazygosporum TaxID=133381 RepID=A0A2T9Z409_9FUNG|nr:hypothetical protein BB560_005526 [Smittium megazygosporum]
MNKTILFLAIQLLLLLSLVFGQNSSSKSPKKPSPTKGATKPSNTFTANVIGKKCKGREYFCSPKNERAYYRCYRGKYISGVCQKGRYCSISSKGGLSCKKRL